MSETDVARLRDVLLQLRADLGAVDTERLGAVMALVDRAAERERIEPLLDSLRPRLRTSLATIARPASLGRILALPFEKLLVAPTAWKPGQVTLPRSVLSPVIGEFASLLGPDEHRLRSMLEGRCMRDIDLVLEVGSVLWPTVSGPLLAFAAGRPTGFAPRNIPMTEAQFRRFCGAIGELLAIGALLAELCVGEVTAERFVELGETALAKAAASGALDTVRQVALICLIVGSQKQLAPSIVTTMLRRAGVGEAEETLGPALAAAVNALDMSVAAEFRVIETAPLMLSRQAAALADRVATALDDRMLARSPDRLRELKGVAERCEALFRSVIEQSLSREGRDRLFELARSAEVPDSAIAEVERAARGMMELVRAARTLSPRAAWLDAVCQDMAGSLVRFGMGLPPGCPPLRLGRRDVARIVEILAGPDAALPLEAHADQ